MAGMYDAVLIEAERLTEWQPISTAPKDGTEILVHSIEGLTIAMWHEDAWCPRHGGNFVYDREEYIEYMWKPPTDWQPLPIPPAEG